MVAKFHRGNLRPALALLALFAHLAAPGFGFGGAAVAVAQTPASSDELARAQEHFDFAEFEPALAIIARIIERPGEPATRLRDAYVLQARCHVGLGNRNLAEDAYCEALARDRQWQPDPIFFTRAEIEVFESAKLGCPPPAAPTEPAPAPPRPVPAAKTSKPWYLKPVVWVGAAAVAVIAVVALGGGGDDDPQSLPDPPPPPQP